MVLRSWLKQPKITETHETTTDQSAASIYLRTGGAAIVATGDRQVSIAAGSHIALAGPDTFHKHFFCDWLLGFADVPGTQVRVTLHGGHELTTPRERQTVVGLLGRSPLLYGETIQESLLYRTQNVRKQDLYALVDRLFGPGLKSRTSPLSPLTDAAGRAVPTQSLTAREHLEIAQINLLLQRTPLVILDLSSELMHEALDQGFRPCDELFSSGKTIIAILPPNRDRAWAEAVTGHKFEPAIRFD